jgi:hypothetical protein
VPKEVIDECLYKEIEGWTAHSMINNPSWIVIDNHGEDKKSILNVGGLNSMLLH